MVGRGASAGGLTEEEIFAAAGPGGSDAFHDADSGVSNDGSSEQEASMMRTSTAGSNSLQERKTVLPKMCTKFHGIQLQMIVTHASAHDTIKSTYTCEHPQTLQSVMRQDPENICRSTLHHTVK